MPWAAWDMHDCDLRPRGGPAPGAAEYAAGAAAEPEAARIRRGEDGDVIVFRPIAACGNWLIFPPDDWAAFLDAVKAGQFTIEDRTDIT
jgi:hypothetical protein